MAHRETACTDTKRNSNSNDTSAVNVDVAKSALTPVFMGFLGITMLVVRWLCSFGPFNQGPNKMELRAHSRCICPSREKKTKGLQADMGPSRNTHSKPHAH